MGGFSSEREVSLKSGNAVYDALKDTDCELMSIDFTSAEELIEKIKQSNVEFIFNALHGAFGEDGRVQQILEDMKISYTGSGSLASALAMDKIASRKIFQEQGLPVPRHQIIHKNQFEKKGLFLEFPVVVKPANEGSSIGLSIVADKESLRAAIDIAQKYDDTIILEKYIRGREITVGILDDKPLPVIEVVPKNKFYDFQAKYSAGMSEYIVPAQMDEAITKKAQQIAVKAHKALGCRCFSRVDMIVNLEEIPVVLEVNTIPGLTSTSLLPKAAKAAGIDFRHLCQKMISYTVINDQLRVSAK